MNTIKDGGPLHPVRIPIPGALHAHDEPPPSELHTGATLRDYFMAHAPAEPQAWFEPTMPQPCPLKPLFPTTAGTEQERSYVREFDLVMNPEEVENPELRAYVVAAQSRRPLASAWLQEQAKQRYVQWPAAWADEMLRARQS